MTKKIIECFICGKKFVKYVRKLRGKVVPIKCCSNVCKYLYLSYKYRKGTKEWKEFYLKELKNEKKKNSIT